MKHITSKLNVPSILIMLVLIFTVGSLQAQQANVKVLKVKTADSTKSNAKIRVVTTTADKEWMEDINPDDIESVDVQKKNGKGSVKITLKNGEIIEKEIDNNSTSKGANYIFVSTDDDDATTDYLKWEELEGIDKDEIESVEVTKDGEKSTIKVLLKNGKVIEKEVDSMKTHVGKMSAKAMFIEELEFDEEAEDGNIFILETASSNDDIMSLEAFKDLDEEEIKEIMVKVKNGVKTITVTTEDGEVIEEVMDVKAGKGTKVMRFNTKGSNAKSMNWVTRGNASNKLIEIQSVDQSAKIEALEERLERMEKKLDELLKALTDTKSKKKKG